MFNPSRAIWEAERGLRQLSDCKHICLKSFRRENVLVRDSIGALVDCLCPLISIVYADFLQDLRRK